MAFKIALEQAIKANEVAAMSWLNAQQSIASKHLVYNAFVEEPSV